jgi:hypothetical protein
MTEMRVLPASYSDLETELGEKIAPFNALFQDSIRYFDSLLGQDARSSSIVEQQFLERFQFLLEQERFAAPRNLRETLIKFSYGFYMKRRG